MEGNLSEKSQDFFHDDNVVQKIFKQYTATKIKSRNFLSNISYAGINNDDVVDKNFCFDVYVLMTKNINPFLLERKLPDQTKHEMIYMLWKECIPVDFYKFICRNEHFSYLNGKNILHPRVSEIVWPFKAEDENNYKKLRENLGKNKEIFQYIYSVTYPEIHCSTEKRGFDLKINIWSHLRNIRTKKIEKLEKIQKLMKTEKKLISKSKNLY